MMFYRLVPVLDDSSMAVDFAVVKGKKVIMWVDVGGGTFFPQETTMSELKKGKYKWIKL